ncbi:MAG: nucleotidyltransferase family protein [Spirochaetota bacterium]
MTAHSIINILKTNSAILKRHHVKRIGVFGSYARGETNRTSDVDLLVEFDERSFGNDCNGYFDTVTSLAGELRSLLNREVDLVTRDMLSPHIAPAVLKEVRYLEGL